MSEVGTVFSEFLNLCYLTLDLILVDLIHVDNVRTELNYRPSSWYQRIICCREKNPRLVAINIEN